MDSGKHPAFKLAEQGIHIRAPRLFDQTSVRAVTDLIAFNTCARYAHFFSEGRYPTNTPPAVMGSILHRTIKQLHNLYQAKQQQGQSDWIPDEATVKEKFNVAAEAAHTQGRAMLTREQRERLERMLCTFHALEAQWFYPHIQAAEVSLRWLWEQAPGGPIVLEGQVDVVLLPSEHTSTGIALWDYKTGKQPEPGTTEHWSYERQMKLYAFLYRQCFKQLPQETALYFMQELAGKPAPTVRPAQALYRMRITEEIDDDVLEWLGDVLTRERTCEKRNEWNPPVDPPVRMCRNCGVQWECPAVRRPYPWEPTSTQSDGEDDAFDL